LEQTVKQLKTKRSRQNKKSLHTRITKGKVWHEQIPLEHCLWQDERLTYFRHPILHRVSKS